MNCRFVVSVDTEEDIWGWRSTAPVTCSNARELPRLARFFSRLHIRPTFFVSYQVLSDPSARSIIAELAAEDGFEIGCHVHPWNTPPDDGSHRRTVLHNFPSNVQAAKIATVTRIYEDLLERRPTSFRAGRFGFGPDTAASLIEQGYLVDSSVTPFFDWTASSRGQNYVGAPLEIYRIRPESGVLTSDPGGHLTEVPLTSGYTGLRPDQWQTAAKLLRHRAVRAFHLGGAAALAGFRKAILSPEPHTVGEMVRLSRAVRRSGVDHLQLFFHSSSLVPGLTPFARTSGEVERLYDRMEELLDRLHRWYDLEYASVTEVAKAFVPEGATTGVQPHEAPSAGSSERSIRESYGQVGRELLRGAAERRGLRARLVHLARSTYWRLGGYRRLRRVRWAEVERLVFVCTGNICRSPYAEHVARARGLEATSVGVDTVLHGVADPMALRVARERGVPMDEHRTIPLGDFRPREGDLFIAMEPFQAAVVAQQPWPMPHQVTLLGLWAGSNGPVIADPYGGEEERFSHCFSVIDHGIARIEKRLGGEGLSERKRRTVPSSDAAS